MEGEGGKVKGGKVKGGEVTLVVIDEGRKKKKLSRIGKPGKADCDKIVRDALVLACIVTPFKKRFIR